MDAQRLALNRPPCSRAESSLAGDLASAFRAAGLETAVEDVRAPTSPSWAPLVGACFRVAAAVLLAVDAPPAALGCAVVAALVAIRPRVLGPVLAALPGTGGRSHNAVGHAPPARQTTDPALIVVAHLDTHPTAGAPLRRPHLALTRLSALVLVAASTYEVVADGRMWRPAVALLALEAIATMLWLARGELSSLPDRGADDNGTGLIALARAAELLAAEPPLRGVWVVATAAGTSGGAGMRAFLKAHPDAAKTAWVIDLDALGAAELVASPVRRRFPRASTPPAVLRAVSGAAIDTGDVIDVRRRSRPHSDAAVAFQRRVPAVTITAGVRPPGDDETGDDANAERAALIVERLARTTL